MPSSRSAEAPASTRRRVTRADDPCRRLDGVGPKLAMRIVNELAGKLGDPALGGAPAPQKGSLAADALSALTGLGFKPAEASKAVQAAQEELGADATLDALVRTALKKAGK